MDISKVTGDMQSHLRRGGSSSGACRSGTLSDRSALFAGTPRVQAGWRPEQGRRFQAGLIRDLFGNPFRPVVLNPTGRPSNVLVLAQAAYEDRLMPSGELNRTRLGILADALEVAGCTEQAILDPLRGPGPHARGC